MSGKRVAPRRAAPPSRGATGTGGHGGTGATGSSGDTAARTARVLTMLAGVAGTSLAWVFLVRSAVAFGATARAGTGAAWGFLAVAALGAVGCLYVALMLLTWTARELGLVRAPGAPPRTPGGRRAAR